MVLQQWYLLQKTNRERNTIRDRGCTAPLATCTDYTAYTANIVYLAYKVAFMPTRIAILCERYGFICFHAQKKRSGLSGRTGYPLTYTAITTRAPDVRMIKKGEIFITKERYTKKFKCAGKEWKVSSYRRNCNLWAQLCLFVVCQCKQSPVCQGSSRASDLLVRAAWFFNLPTKSDKILERYSWARSS